MDHLSDWHRFDPANRKTYPQVPAPVQVQFDNGQMEEGDSLTFFPQTELLPSSSITGWRYIKGVAQR
jgi:hypothetical protein